MKPLDISQSNMKSLSISQNNIKQIIYDVIGAGMSGVNKRPLQDMKDLGIHLIEAVPETIGDCWICLTDSNVEFPKYISVKTPKLHSWYWQMWDIDIIS